MSFDDNRLDELVEISSYNENNSSIRRHNGGDPQRVHMEYNPLFVQLWLMESNLKIAEHHHLFCQILRRSQSTLRLLLEHNTFPFRQREPHMFEEYILVPP
jgi:hypothetical protein